MRVRFGDLLLDTEEHVLLERGVARPLSPKAFRLLALLVENRPAVLSKETIAETLWPTTFVSEGNLTVLMAEVRKALGESARARRFIRTVHGVGYAFVGGAAGETEDRPPLREGRLLRLEDLELPLRDGENVLGRDVGCAVRVDRPTVSRRHARILVSADGVVLEDLGSKNGTFLGGGRLTGPVALSEGDVIGLGSVRLVFRVRRAQPTTRTES